MNVGYTQGYTSAFEKLGMGNPLKFMGRVARGAGKKAKGILRRKPAAAAAGTALPSAPKAPMGPAESSAQVFMNAPEKAPTKAPGLLRKGLPYLAVGGGAYALSRAGNQPATPQQPQQAQQYYSNPYAQQMYY